MPTEIHTTANGGGFLLGSVDPKDVFTRDDLSEEQLFFGRTAAEFMQREVLPNQARLAAHDWTLARALMHKAAELDLTRLEIPEAYGGLGLDKVSAAYVGEQIAVEPSFAGTLGGHTSIGTLPLVYFGTEEQKAKYLPRLASAELIGAYALTEPQSGSDALAARTTARLTPDGTHYVLKGQKAWITNGGFADLFTLFAKVDGEHFTAFLVERDMGVVSGPDEAKLGLDGSSTTVLMLDDVRVPVGNVLGTIGKGHKVAFNVLNLGRVKLGTRNMAGARQALDRAIAYSKERRQFGRAICEFGLVKQKLAEMAVRCFVGDAMVYRTIGGVERALETVPAEDSARVLKVIETFAIECSVNKVWTSETLGYATDEAIQIFGGNGYSREFPVEQAYRDARITRIYEGTNEINRLLIPTRLVKQDADAYGGDHARRVLSEGNPTTSTSASAAPFESEHRLLTHAKQSAIAALGLAAETHGAELKEEQEVVGRIADMVCEVYALESALARATRLAARHPGDVGQLGQDLARLYAAEAAHRLTWAAGPVVAALAGHGVAPQDVQALRESTRRLAVGADFDAIAALRRVGDHVIRVGRYPL